MRAMQSGREYCEFARGCLSVSQLDRECSLFSSERADPGIARLRERGFGAADISRARNCMREYLKAEKRGLRDRGEKRMCVMAVT